MKQFFFEIIADEARDCSVQKIRLGTCMAYQFLKKNLGLALQKVLLLTYPFQNEMAPIKK